MNIKKSKWKQKIEWKQTNYLKKHLVIELNGNKRVRKLINWIWLTKKLSTRTTKTNKKTPLNMVDILTFICVAHFDPLIECE